MRLANSVLTGNLEIEEFARRFNSRVEKFEGSVDIDSYPVKEHQPAAPVVIGWVGHFAEERVGLILPALSTASRCAMFS